MGPVILVSVLAFVVVPALASVLVHSLLYSMVLLLALAFVVVGAHRVGIHPCWGWHSLSLALVFVQYTLSADSMLNPRPILNGWAHLDETYIIGKR
jgi:hypothetical protein